MVQITVNGSRSFKGVGFILTGLLRKKSKPNDSYTADAGNEKSRCLRFSPAFLINRHRWHLFVEWFQETMQFKFSRNFQQTRKSGVNIVKNTCFITEFKHVY